MENNSFNQLFKTWIPKKQEESETQHIVDNKPKEDKEDYGSIDFTNVMKNKEAYFDWEDVIRIINYFYDQGMIKEGLLFHVLAYTGRRITELIGKPPYSPDKTMSLSNYKGLRPIDFHDKTMQLSFQILKKSHIKKIRRNGTKRTEKQLFSLQQQKEPKTKLLPVPEELYSLLKEYINKANLGLYDRLFPFSRMKCDRLIKEATEHLNIKPQLGIKRMRVHYSDKTSKIIEIPKRPHCHMFRHSFAIHFIKKNQDNPKALLHLSDYLDHSSFNMTKSYLQFANKEMTDIINKTF